MRLLWTVLGSALLAGACCPDCPPVLHPDGSINGTDASAGQDAGVSARGFRATGSAIAMTADDSAALFLTFRTGAQQGRGQTGVAKYTLNLTASPPTMTAAGSIDDIGDAHQLIIGPDNDTAYAASAMGLLKLTGISGPNPPRMALMTDVGAEPRGMALSPSGALLYVASWMDGTVTVYNTSDLSTKSTIDLNRTLAASGLLGPNISPRPALAHPYAVAITDNGDSNDNDETVYVTEFFSQMIAGVPIADDRWWDIGRQGIVYRFDVATETVKAPISLSARMISDPTFVDSETFTTGCFPNQLSASAIHDGKLFVAGTCASPRGPIGPVIDPMSGQEQGTSNFKTVVHPAIWIVDTASNTELPLASALLSESYQQRFDADQVPDDQHRRMPLDIRDMIFAPGTNDLYLVARGADAIFRISYDANASAKMASPYFIDLAQAMPRPGTLPRGIAISTRSKRALVINEHSRNVSILDLDAQSVLVDAEIGLPGAVGPEQRINDGHRDFVTGLGRWSYLGQAWSACESCHPEGLSDGVTWFLPTGPRQTPALDGAFSKNQMNTLKFFGWTADADEVSDYEMFTRRISGGVGAIVHGMSSPPINDDRIVFAGENPIASGQVQASERDDGINGSTANLLPSGGSRVKSVVDDWDFITAYLQVVRPPRSPSNISMSDVAAGLVLFVGNNCVGCHAAEEWTISRRFYTPSPMLNDPDPMHGVLAMGTYMARGLFPAGINPPLDRTPMPPLRTPGAQDAMIECILRSVGTYGVAPIGVRVKEVRDDMQTASLGTDGYNPPSLFSLGVSAPYLHAGNARTLEELFTDTFAAHSAAFPVMGQMFPGSGDRATLVRQLIAFLLSINDQMMPENPPQQINGFSPLLCPLQFP
jgi:DNA-binding beta-propeller fold protein YncE